MTTPDDDKALDEYLSGRSVVSAQYRALGVADIPPDLDREILQQATLAVKRSPARSRTWLRWSAPLALAASAVLVVSVVVNNGVQQDAIVSGQIAPSPAREAKTEPVAQGGQSERRLAQESAEAVQVVPIESPSFEAPPVLEVRKSGPAPTVPALANAAGDSQPRATAPQVLVPPPPPVLAESTDSSAAPATAIRSVVVTGSRPRGGVEDAAAPVAVMPMQKAGGDVQVEPITVLGSPIRPEPAAPSAGPRGTIIAPDAAELRARHAGAESAASEQESREADPRRWLEHIRQLRRDGKRSDADREWLAFEKRYPQHPVAADDTARMRR